MGGRIRTRRRVLVSLAAACAVSSFAQTDTRFALERSEGAADGPDPTFGKILIAALADLGYELGRNLNSSPVARSRMSPNCRA